MDNYKGIFCLVAGVLIQLFNGVFFLWANIGNYVASYLFIYDKNVTADAIYYVDMALTFSTLLGYQIGAYLINEKQWNPKLIMFLGASLALVGFITASYTTKEIYFVLLYGSLSGIGLGINYLVPFVCGWKYFPNNKGLVSGIISGAYGMSNVVYSFLSTKLVNPENKKATIIINADLKYFEEDVASRVPEMIRFLCIIWFFQIILAILLISQPKDEIEKDDNILETSQTG